MSASSPAVRAASAEPGARAVFIKKTYLYIAVAIAGFAVVEALLLDWPWARDVAGRLTQGYSWLLVILVFGIVTTFADRLARTTASTSKICVGFVLFIVAEAVIFLPLLLGVATQGEDALATDALITGVMVVALTTVAFVSGADFSFRRGALIVGSFLSLGLIVASILFGFSLGPLFAFMMVAFAAGSILANTAKALRTYRTDQPLAAALSLIASIALLFWYVTSYVSRRRRTSTRGDISQ